MSAPVDHDEDLCVCGHERWKHSLANKAAWADVGCTHVIRPASAAVPPFECHCTKYRRAEDQTWASRT